MTSKELEHYIKGEAYKRALGVFRKRNPSCGEDDYLAYLKAKHTDALRKCKKCGVEANNEDDLHLFVKNSSCRYSREGICKKCYNERLLQWINSTPESIKKSKDSKDKYSKSEKGRLNGRVHLQYKRAVKRNAVPDWISQEELNKIKSLHHQASILSTITGYDWDVDHIYPSIHPTMCGLHIFDNLILMPKSDNRVKNNKLGYLHQYNCSELSQNVSTRTSRDIIYKLLGSSMSWEDFLEYEKINYKDYV